MTRGISFEREYHFVLLFIFRKDYWRDLKQYHPKSSVALIQNHYITSPFQLKTYALLPAHCCTTF